MSDDLFDVTFRIAPGISRSRVALGDAAYQLEVSSILNHWLRSRSLNRASLARHVPTNLAAYSTDTLRMVSAHRYTDSFSFPSS
jgi:hypothetical protein